MSPVLGSEGFSLSLIATQPGHSDMKQLSGLKDIVEGAEEPTQSRCLQLKYFQDQTAAFAF